MALWQLVVLVTPIDIHECVQVDQSPWNYYGDDQEGMF